MRDKINNWYLTHMNKENALYALRVSVGIIFSILLAEAIGIEFAPSTGIITLLTMQATKRETISTIIRKVISFGYTLLFALVIHEHVGTGILAFSLVILIMVVLSILLGWYDTLSVNVVIAVHLFMQQEAFTSALLLNETYRFCIGIAVAFIINLGVLDQEKELIKATVVIERTMKEIMMLYVNFMYGKAPLPEMTSILSNYRKKLDTEWARALANANNHLLSHYRYYVNYMDMRMDELSLIENIDAYLRSLPTCPQNAALVADYMEHIANSLRVERPLDEWTLKYDEVTKKLDQEALPASRSEFHEQSNLFFIFYELSKMLIIRKDFLAALSKKQRKLYFRK